MATLRYCGSRIDARLATAAALCLALSGMAPHGRAGAEDLRENVQIHGFATQAFITTTANNFFGETSDRGNFDFTELGVNASLQPSASLQFAGQILSRRAGDGDDGGVRVDYGLADYSIRSNPTDRFGIRAGRILNPLGLYNETRDVAFTRPSIFLPQSIYFDRTRDLALSSDGLQLYGEHRSGGNEIFWQFGVALPRVDDEEILKTLLGDGATGDLDSKVSYLGRVLWEGDGGRIRVALSTLQVNIDSGDTNYPGDITFKPTILSAQYNAERWSVTSEYARRHFEYENFPLALLNMSFTGESGYLQGSYRFAETWDAFLRYDALYSDRSDRNGEDYAASPLGAGKPAHVRFAKDATVGLGWKVTPVVLLRTEFHRVNGSAWLPVADNPVQAAKERHWNMFAFTASYRF